MGIERRKSKRTRPTGAAFIGLLALVVSACVPYFAVPSAVTSSAIDGPNGTNPTLAIVWTSAQDDDLADIITSYDIELDGTVIASLPAPLNACGLSGLASQESYAVSVVANSSDGTTSSQIGGAASSMGRLQHSITTDSVGGAGVGGALTCVPLADSDSDRLPDLFETNTGTYVDQTATGTDPANPDSDNDGLIDGDEVWRIDTGLDLTAMGVDPLRQDILLEFDWFDDAISCGAHTHRPTDAAIADVTAAFANAPTANPDGSTGINLITDRGQGGPFTGGNLVADADGVIAGGIGGTDYRAIRSANFSPARDGRFHYVLMPHHYATNATSSGQAELNGDDMIVSNNCLISVDFFVARTIMHELGHNLSLQHGGNVLTNWKPNYNSVMNYRYQFFGAETDCEPLGFGVTDYSRGTLASLDESDLDENDGICDNVAIDWDDNGAISTGVATDINRDLGGVGDGLLTALHDHNDWANLNLAAVAQGNGARRAPPTIITEDPVPPQVVELLVGE